MTESRIEPAASRAGADRNPSATLTDERSESAWPRSSESCETRSRTNASRSASGIARADPTSCLSSCQRSGVTSAHALYDVQIVRDGTNRGVGIRLAVGGDLEWVEASDSGTIFGC